MFKKIEKSEGIYWVTESSVSKIGFKNWFSAFDWAYTGLATIAFFALPIAMFILLIMSVA